MKYLILFLLIGLAVSQNCINCPNQCGSNGICNGCDNGYFLDNTGTCGRYTPIEDCKIYDITTGGCYACFPGNLLQYGICQELIQNCNYTITNNTEICTTCNSSYVLVNDIHCYSDNVANCPSGALPRILQTSKIGYCQKFQLQKCSIPSDDVSYCKVCLTPYTNLNGVCNNITNQVSCPSNNCQCQFYYKDSICYQFQIDGCLTSKDKLYCDLCDDKLVAVSGRCFQPVKISDIHCNVLQLNSDICTGCNFQYLLDPNSICVKNFNICSNKQKSCQSLCNNQNLLYYNGQCYIKDQQCISYDIQFNRCTKCYQGFQLNQYYKCQKKQKCYIYTATNNKICSKCFTGFQLNINNYTCDKLPYNCKQMNNVGKCITCSNYTDLINQQILSNQLFLGNQSIGINTTICVYSTLNCLYYNIYGFCQICKPLFIQIKHQCISIATNCLLVSITDQSKCQICNTGYQLDITSQICYPRIQGCLQYITNINKTKQCSRCKQLFTLRNGLCFYNDGNCLQFNSKGFCMRCNNNLVPYYNQCVFYDPFCYLYDKLGLCIMSHSGFSQNTKFTNQLQINYRSFIAYLKNIQQVSSNSGSSSGSSQYSEISIYGGYYTSQGWIRVLPTIGLYNQRILQYDLNGKIRFCRQGYTYLNNNCVLKIDYCNQYSSSNGLCVRCNAYYHLGPQRKCVPLTASICLIPTSTGQYCSKCGPQYTLINGQCYYSQLNVIQSSSSSSSSTKVTSVQNGYYIWQKYQIAYPYDTNCANQNQPGNCLQCIQQSQFTQSGMRNINGKCILIKQNCNKYNIRGLCQSCSQGYYLYYGQCYPNNCLTQSITDNVCATCPYLFTYQSGICVNRLQTNCLVYDQINSYNTSIRSINCKYCTYGYYLKSDYICSQMIINCQITNTQSGRCTSCINGFTLYQQKCILQIIGCLVYNNLNNYQTCKQCIQNYDLILNNTKCVTLPLRCLELNSTGYCAKCSTGYNPIVQNSISICIFTVSNCVLYDAQGRCTTCNKNYVLQNNLCNFYVPGCNSLINNTCVNCLPGFYLRNGYCIRDSNCVLADSPTNCLKCIDGYRLMNGICIKNSIDNCLTQKDDDCLECLNGYVRITLYGKVYCILKRIIISGCTTQQYPCPKCQQGFQLRDDGFCYAQKCKSALTRFSLRTCDSCYPYYKLDPTNRFCILYNCNSISCYGSTDIPSGFIQTNRSGFIIYIKYCTQLEEDYSCHKCSNYRKPNNLIQWKLCYPYNCKSNQLIDCNGNCYNYFNNLIVNDTAVCLAQNCQIYNNDGTCSVCIKPYNVVNGICLYQGPCSDYNPATNQCRNCRDGYNLISGSCIPKNCTSYSPSDVSTCLQCAKGFQLTVNKTCQLKYCANLNQNYPCLQCRTGFYFNPLTNLCHMHNCKVFDYGNDLCTYCQIGYNLLNGYCIPDQCSSFDQSTWKCTQCQQGYKLNNNGICVIDNCCTFNGLLCAQCCSGYDYINGVCKSRCQIFNPSGVCITCLPEYKLNSNNQCVTQISGCVSYNGNICLQCQAGLIIYNGICIPKYCSNYSPSNPIICLQCLPRFYLLSNSGLCYPKNCINFNSSSWTCLSCQYGPNYRYSLVQKQGLCFTDHCLIYQLNDYVCKQCQNSTTSIKAYQLQVFNNTQICYVQCGLYYQLINNQCKLKYCSNYNPSGRCLSCAPGYQLELSTGYCKLKFCLGYIQQDCATCASGYTLDSLNRRYCVPINCQNYNIGSNICQKCKDGYIRQYNLCILKDCYIYNNQYLCTKCLDGFNLIQQSNGLLICQKIYNSTCNQGYYFSTSRGSCQPISIQYCRYINPLSLQICLSCFDNYFLYQGICYSLNGCQQYQFSYIYGCRSCITGYKLNGNLCIKDYCEQYNINNICKYCINGYYLINGNCISYIDYCLNGNVNQGCINCQNGYQSIGGLCKKLPDYCLSINNQLKCIQCLSGYSLYNNICYQSIPNCVNQIGSICSKCDTLFILSADQRSCISKQPIRYCQQHDSTYQYCLICHEGFSNTSDRKCLANHCSKYDLQTYICTQCLNQTINGVSYFYVLRNQKCSLITINYCNIPLNQNICRICVEGYSPINGICKAQNCQNYKSSNQQQCLMCINGYYLSTNKNICIKYPDYCSVVDSNGICKVCISGYTLNSNNVCIKSTDFCLKYSVDGVCVNCIENYYLTVNRICLKLPDNCLAANFYGFCLQCVNPYALSSSGVCYRLIDNCLKYNDLGSCITCNNRYYLNNNGVCALLSDNCLLATSTGICRQCVSGYRLQNNMCLHNIDNCGSYSNNACIACINGYYLINGLCYKLSSNCIVVNQLSQCLQCENGFTLYKGYCYLKIPYCQFYNPLGQCSQCLTGYYANSNGKCSQIPNNCAQVNYNGICLQCLPGFILSNGICYRQISNCNSYNSQTNLCRQCINGYYLIDGKCYQLSQNCLAVNIQQICVNCISGYTLQNGICYINLPNCEFYLQMGRCSKCANGYYLALNSTCTSIPQGCNSISPNNTQGCLNCISGYILQGGICFKQYPNCFIYNQTTKQCRQCLQDYYLLNGFCYQLPINCLSVDTQKQCTGCRNGYILQNGGCYKNIDYCLAYGSGNICVQCRDGYFYNGNGACVPSPPNCNQVGINGACLKCVDGFILQNDVCYKFDANCLAYNATTYVCRSCIDGYYLNYQYSCQLIPTNCANANAYGICISCRPNYSLSNGLCYAIIPQCDQFDPNTLLCAKCLPTYFLKDGFCYRTIEYCLIYSPTSYNCVKCQDNYILTNNICITCGDGSYVDNYGQCKQNPLYCKYSNQYGQCLQCVNGYMSINGICTQQITYCQNYTTLTNGLNICTQCYIGYYLRDQTTCLRLPNGCAVCNSTGYCLQCYQGYASNINGICYTLVQYCQTYQLATGICLQCIPNYYLNVNQTCTPILGNNCLFANSLGQCIQCIQNYVLVNSYCYIAIPNCFNHSTSSYTCLQCFNGYFLFNQTCNRIPNGCQTMINNNNRCASCMTGYQLTSSGLCQLTDNSICIQYQLLSGICILCKAGYYLTSNNICALLPDSCTQANSQGLCINCIAGFTLSNGICYKNIPNCLKWNGNLCVQCADLYYLQNSLCYKYPDNCLTYDSFSLKCIKCITGYQILNGYCIISNPSTNCNYFNPSSSNQCYTCKNTFYQYWINQSTGQIISSITTIDNFCRSYPQYCTNVDLLGNCISCCYASTLSNGKCIGTTLRSLNCDLFDSLSMKCLKCMIGYVYCQGLAICIEVNINCLNYNSFTNQCLKCVDGFTLINGDCINASPGISSSSNTVGICNTGYTYFTNNQYGSPGCFRNKNQLVKGSAKSSIKFYTTSYQPGSSFIQQQIMTGSTWNPPTYLNNYISMKSTKTQIIHYIQIQGTSSGYVTYYLIHYRNKQNSPFICWNSCQKIKGNINSSQISQLRLSYPIIGRQLRIYPLKWINGIWMSLQILIENQ